METQHTAATLKVHPRGGYPFAPPQGGAGATPGERQRALTTHVARLLHLSVMLVHLGARPTGLHGRFAPYLIDVAVQTCVDGLEASAQVQEHGTANMEITVESDGAAVQTTGVQVVEVALQSEILSIDVEVHAVRSWREGAVWRLRHLGGHCGAVLGVPLGR